MYSLLFKIAAIVFLGLLAVLAYAAVPSPKQKFEGSEKSVFDFTVKSLEGEETSLSKYKGKKLLIVNVASECGYTPQYKGLQQLSEKYKDKLTVIGFPANNFGKQEPGSSTEIRQFCTKNYGVTFPMMEKISVKGEDMHPLYRWLSDKSANGS